ncbi:serine/threonine protein kinase [Micromonosporaceae bacterium Da 78-11]
MISESFVCLSDRPYQVSHRPISILLDVQDRDRGGGAPLRYSDPVVVDGYRLLSRLGEGGMADVFQAVLPVRGDRVAVKVLREGGMAATCQREFELASTVDVVSTAAPLGYGAAPEGPYLVTACLPGYRSGTAWMNHLPSGRLWAFGSALARVLAAVHARGVVHCDIKPSNLLIRGDDVRVIDFGISQYVGECHDDDGIVRCSSGWAAPEQLLNTAAAPPPLDVFAWGCVLAFTASGIHPFAGRDEQEWMLRVVSAQPHLRGLPAGMEEVVRAALAHEPRDRPSAQELAAVCRQHAQRWGCYRGGAGSPRRSSMLSG